MPAARKDQWANLYELNMTMSAADTITFTEISMGLTVFDKVALVIHRLEYELPTGAVTELTTASDIWKCGIVTDNTITDLNFSTAAVVDFTELLNSVAGTAGSHFIFNHPIIKDYTGLPGGGLLVTPRPLYLGCHTAHFGSASGVTMRMYFTVKQLKADEYFELFESRRYYS